MRTPGRPESRDQPGRPDSHDQVCWRQTGESICQSQIHSTLTWIKWKYHSEVILWVLQSCLSLMKLCDIWERWENFERTPSRARIMSCSNCNTRFKQQEAPNCSFDWVSVHTNKKILCPAGNQITWLLLLYYCSRDDDDHEQIHPNTEYI